MGYTPPSLFSYGPSKRAPQPAWTQQQILDASIEGYRSCSKTSLPLIMAGAIGATFLGLTFADKIDVSGYLAQLTNLPKTNMVLQAVQAGLSIGSSAITLFCGGMGVMSALSIPTHKQNVISASYNLALEQAQAKPGRTNPVTQAEVCAKAQALVAGNPKTTPRLLGLVAKEMHALMGRG